MDLDFEIFTPETEEDFASLWRFNYDIFAAELKMRPENPDGFLVDKFHHKNIYLAARNKSDNAIIGMIAAHWQPPYSAEAHFGPSVAEPPADGGELGEIRLFSVAPPYRKTAIVTTLGISMLLELAKHQVTEVVISGISVQRHFYERLGFKVTGEPVAEGETTLYPMRIKLPDFIERCKKLQCFKFCN